MPKPKPIGLIDSGVGALTIFQEISNLLPNLAQVIVCDHQQAPYGNKSPDFVCKRVCGLSTAAHKNHDFSVLIVACNTASTVVLPQLRLQFAIPIIGVIPAIKPAAAISQTKVVGLLATPPTINRAYTNDLIAKFGKDCKFLKIGSQRLVEIAEQKIQGHRPDRHELMNILQPLFADPRLDTVVLGCTHFPILKADFERLAPRPIQWIDSGAAIARRLQKIHDASHKNDNCDHKILLTGNLTYPEAWFKSLATYGIKNISRLQEISENEYISTSED